MCARWEFRKTLKRKEGGRALKRASAQLRPPKLADQLIELICLERQASRAGPLIGPIKPAFIRWPPPFDLAANERAFMMSAVGR